jgi:hypothetical protein
LYLTARATHEKISNRLCSPSHTLSVHSTHRSEGRTHIRQLSQTRTHRETPVAAHFAAVFEFVPRTNTKIRPGRLTVSLVKIRFETARCDARSELYPATVPLSMSLIPSTSQYTGLWGFSIRRIPRRFIRSFNIIYNNSTEFSQDNYTDLPSTISHYAAAHGR